MPKDETSDLRYASSNLIEARMMHEVHGHGRRPKPPSLSLPSNAREGDPSPSSPPSPDVSARPSKPVSARVEAEEMDEASKTRRVLQLLDSLGDDFYAHTTDEERAAVRRATCLPKASFERAMQTNPMWSVASASLLAMGAGVMLGSMLASPSPPQQYRSSSSHSPPGMVDRLLSYL